ncbi:hypothetical protein RHE_PC00096 (plasmid) [Rhizobium etli CFN 42]|uniref:Uncharacterized protein n=2 Tax=Rhizobium etli TaxID=29449 RepID=Q2K1E1_RHIEC|nr:hypothetical protein [Rhizobium etli]ABC93303.1 hypothetical protein RHE_PC00096 [Rhizobium etli CFN 42]AGS24229.1 hypothetical protein REMIM1_PB00108 [Rhizobium etli bv. mimosae str. Mim1]ARQ12512.1 hypothetical protein NXC12_PB00108 [Rhizobium etli]
MQNQRYALQKNLNIYWTVIDTVSDRKALVDGFVMDMLTADEAEEMVNMLNRAESHGILAPAQREHRDWRQQ